MGTLDRSERAMTGGAGQKFGKAAFQPSIRLFINLSSGGIEALWEAFNDVSSETCVERNNRMQVADGFGISLPEMQLVCAQLSGELALARPQLDLQVETLFRELDADNNALVDAIEFLASLAAASGITLHDKLEFVFNCFDFDATGKLSVDEITLAFRCTLMGLCKLCKEACPLEEELEVIAMRAFTTSLFKPPSQGDNLSTDPSISPLAKIRILDAISFCLSDPEVRSWLEFFDDPDPISSVSGKLDELTSNTSAAAAATTLLPDENNSNNKVTTAQLFLETIEYVPTTQDADYDRDFEFPSRSAAVAAALEGAPTVAAALASEAKRLRNPRGDPPPWQLSVAALTPTTLSNQDPDLSLPESSLVLEWVHGYHGEDCRGNVWYTGSGEIVYPAARLGVIYSSLEHSQRHMTLHDGEVSCVAVSPDGLIAATGDVGERPRTICWDIGTCAPLSILAGIHSVAIAQVAFSPDGEFLATVGASSCTLVLYRWRTRERIYSSQSELRGKSLGLAFTSDSHDSIVLCGVYDPYISFWWRESATDKIAHRRGAFGRRARRQPTLCVARCGDVTLSGQASGHLYVWHGRNCVQSIKAHRGALNAIHVNIHGVVSGGKDGKVRQWSHALEPGATFDITDFGSKPTIRSVCRSQDGTKVLVGTGGNEIFELSSADGSDTLGGPVTSTHFDSPLLGLSPHPLKAEFATCGVDCTVRIWDILTRNPVRTARLDTPAACCSYHPSGDVIAVGLGHSTHKSPVGGETKNGAFVVLNDIDLSISFEARDSKLPLVSCRFSPDGEVLAFGSRDASIYMYAYAEGYELIGICRRHPSPVITLDFSSDSRWLRSGCEAGQLHFFNANSGQYQSNVSALKDLRWGTESCLFAFGAAGAQATTTVDDATLTACARVRVCLSNLSWQHR
ncbi:hypothetical protein CTAYLR_004254 [Chrysophaeum taylorii]|uniref:EF-hand domain-containing protein n=1 Tax=Chrysophaeum taylorii TaxID=2483200 RepID=A0AAD7UEI2_9STRA|nr:hypothetical protein CTAYLR_004254 [Chrysophaeum taylorii]